VSICERCCAWHGVERNDLVGISTPKAGRLIVPGTGDAILLTGATGFVGIAVLERLLEHTDRDVVVLVRAEHDLRFEPIDRERIKEQHAIEEFRAHRTPRASH
jgi:NADPH:quinone reductase-like Zn-dependent oxidoreductase